MYLFLYFITCLLDGKSATQTAHRPNTYNNILYIYIYIMYGWTIGGML